MDIHQWAYTRSPQLCSYSGPLTITVADHSLYLLYQVLCCFKEARREGAASAGGVVFFFHFMLW